MQQEGSFNLVGRKIMIGIPSYDYKVATKWAISFAHFCVEAQKHGVQIQVGNVSGCSVVSRARNLIAYDFLESDCTDLMFIDSDITFNADDVFRLMAWNSDPKKGIVAGIPVARKKGKVYISTLDIDVSSPPQRVTLGRITPSATVPERLDLRFGLIPPSSLDTWASMSLKALLARITCTQCFAP